MIKLINIYIVSAVIHNNNKQMTETFFVKPIHFRRSTFNDLKFICNNIVDINEKPIKVKVFDTNICFVNVSQDMCSQCGNEGISCIGHLWGPRSMLECIIMYGIGKMFLKKNNKFPKIMFDILALVLNNGFDLTKYKYECAYDFIIGCSTYDKSMAKVFSTVIDNYVAPYILFVNGLLKCDIYNILIIPKKIVEHYDIPILLLLFVKYTKYKIFKNVIKHLIIPYVFT